MTTRPGAVRRRTPVLAAGGFALLTGLYAALLFGVPDRPLPARAGERLRVWLLGADPNRGTSFHVGAQFGSVYREGRWESPPADPGGAQVLPLAPAAGGFVRMVLPEPGCYPFVSHAMVDAARGTRGLFEVEVNP
ncbi:hypothetical protein ABGB16_24135 [Micromonospora sp. B11E3]|uniref:hypothetical protein n=1 Tax=Micromonospora sp. B11E3 TaxID=3153562 RepID=UPI00325C787A